MMNELSLLDELLNGSNGFFSTMGTSIYSPDADVMQTKDAYTITMDLPGKSEKDVDISLKDNVLTIASVEVKADEKADNKTDADTTEDNELRFLLRERRTSTFTRSFKLPRDINAADTEAVFTNGVLTVTVPRKPEEEAKKIAIRVA